MTLRKDIFNEEHLLEKGLNERQVRAVMYVKENERVTNRELIDIIYWRNLVQVQERIITHNHAKISHYHA